MEISAYGGHAFVYCENGLIESLIQFPHSTVTRVSRDFVGQWLAKRRLAVSEQRRMDRTTESVDDIAGTHHHEDTEYNPR